MHEIDDDFYRQIFGETVLICDKCNNLCLKTTRFMLIPRLGENVGHEKTARLHISVMPENITCWYVRSMESSLKKET